MESLTRLLNACHLLQGKVIALIGDNAPDTSDIGAVGDLIGQCRHLFEEYVAEAESLKGAPAVKNEEDFCDPNRTALISDDEDPDADPNRTAIIDDAELSAIMAEKEAEPTVENLDAPQPEQKPQDAVTEELREIAIDNIEVETEQLHDSLVQLDAPVEQPAELTIEDEPQEDVLDEEQAETDQYISLDDLSSVEPEDNGVIRVDEMLQRKAANDIRRAFTLNDKYRFRRELFGNSDAALNDALDIVSAMHSYDEACDYFRNDLGWDTTSEDVKDFLEVIASHFK